MWRVTLNCSRNQTPWAARPPTLPQPLRFPAKAHARHAPTPEPAHPSRLLSLPCRRALGPAAGPTAVPSSRKSPGVNRRRLGTAALPRGRAAGRTLQPGSAAPPPRLLPSPPLPGARPAITWVLRRVAAVPPRARPRKLSARGADVLGLSTRCRRRRRRRGSTAFCVPVGVGRSRTERQTRQPNRHRFYLAPPVQPSAAPIGGPRGGLPSNHRARRARGRGVGPTQRRPRDSARPGGRRVRAGAGGRRGALRRVETPRSLFVLSRGARRLSGKRRAGGQAGGARTRGLRTRLPAGGRLGGAAGPGRRAGRRARGAWREPPPRSSRACGAGRGRKPSLNQFKTRGW